MTIVTPPVPNPFFVAKQLFAGQSVARIYMNSALAEETLHGRVVDVGGGRHPDYFNFFKKDATVSIEALDGSLSGIDFENEALPYADGIIDTIIACNVLEHIYNYRFLLGEMARIAKPNTGRLIGFVPFWVGYHPDPHDYFRYTGEALARLFMETGFIQHRIVPLGGGPILANFNTIVLSLPRWMRPMAYLPCGIFDALFVFLRPQSAARNPLGYLFVASKGIESA